MATSNQPGAPRVSVVLPVFGHLANVHTLLAELRSQTIVPYEIILVDSSPVGLAELPEGVIYLKNQSGGGLSDDYNLGAERATGDHLLLLQQDCLPSTRQDLEQLLSLLTPGRVAVTASVRLPAENWKKYNFWGQALMARWVGTVRQGISGKFDLHRTEIFRRVGGYDTARFSYAGEDMDLFLRLSAEGEVRVAATSVLHLHNQSRTTTCQDIFKKTYQLAESFGALVRKWGFQLRHVPYAGHWTHHLTKYLYVLIPLALLYPWPWLGVLLVLSQVTNIEVWRIRSPRVILFLLLNPILLLVSAAGTLKGFVTGRQRYSVNRSIKRPPEPGPGIRQPGSTNSQPRQA